MTLDKLEQRRVIVENLRLAAQGSELPIVVTPESAQVLLQLLDEAKFVAEEYLGTDMYGQTAYTEHVARNIVHVVKPTELPSERVYEPTEAALEHVEANDYNLKPEYTSVWIGIGSIAVYVRRMNGQVVVELCPNNDEAAATVYDSCSAYLETGE